MTSSEFLITKEYRKFEEFCNACFREKYIGICYGTPGVGKTLSARYYAKFDLFDRFGYTKIPEDEKLDLAKQIVSTQAFFYTASVTNTPNRIKAELKKEHVDLLMSLSKAKFTIEKEYTYDTDRSALVIIDEADRLKMGSLEQVRDFYDREENWGIVLIGMPGLEKRLARYPQLYSRVGFAHEFRPIGQEEMFFILEHHWNTLGLELDQKNFSDTEAITAVARITNGNFRLIHRLFSQIKRIMKVNNLISVSKEVVEAARDCMVIGNY